MEADWVLLAGTEREPAAEAEVLTDSDGVGDDVADAVGELDVVAVSVPLAVADPLADTVGCCVTVRVATMDAVLEGWRVAVVLRLRVAVNVLEVVAEAERFVAEWDPVSLWLLGLPLMDAVRVTGPLSVCGSVEDSEAEGDGDSVGVALWEVVGDAEGVDVCDGLKDLEKDSDAPRDPLCAVEVPLIVCVAETVGDVVEDDVREGAAEATHSTDAAIETT